MDDVTLVRGYGVPRAGGMDYAGYGHFGAADMPGLFAPMLDPQHGLNGFAYADVESPMMKAPPATMLVQRAVAPASKLPFIGAALLAAYFIFRR